jgi:hypothetical protein
MGAMGVAMLGMVYCIFKSIVSLIKFFIWKNKINAIGVVEKLKSKDINYENYKKKKISSICYTYSISVNDNGNTYSVDYVETVFGDNLSKVVLNSSIPVFVDVNKKIAKNAKDMKNQIWQWSVGFLSSAAVFIVCIIIVATISN